MKEANGYTAGDRQPFEAELRRFPYSALTYSSAIIATIWPQDTVGGLQYGKISQDLQSHIQAEIGSIGTLDSF